MDDNCSGVECGGRINYCAWWKVGKCITEREKDVDDTHHVTCTKIQGNLLRTVFCLKQTYQRNIYTYIYIYLIVLF